MEDIKTTNIENKPIEKTYSFYNLLVFDKELNIVNLINFSNRNLKDNIYDDNSFYVEIPLELFIQIRMLLDSNTLKLTKNPLQEQITIQDIQATPLPPTPPTPEEAINNSLLNVTMGIGKLNTQVNAISDGMFNEIEERVKIKKQIEALNTTVLMLTMKLGGK
ncbi:hypothetical protein [Clostridium thermobutyricum]|uniref:hypothetical protein n=1 Tax=Clostridium thermobutyricum TaxID=29372 RepID=UPI0018AA91CF|nr:hypothetical protein [Clostridium thermobutyricum]